MLLTLVKKCRKSHSIVVFGAGVIGRELTDYLHKNGVQIDAFFDNNHDKDGSRIQNIPVKIPHKLDGDDTLYIAAAFSEETRKQMKEQMRALGIPEEQILTCSGVKDYEYYRNLDESEYKRELSELYLMRMGRELNWDNPSTYTEIINWEKLNLHDERKTLLADKIGAKKYIKEKIGEKYLAKIYGIWNDADEINFEQLPKSFVLKLNHGSGFGIVVPDKEAIDQESVRKQLMQWKSLNYAYCNGSFEMHYRDIIPRIICEEYLEGVAESVYDYGVYCFHGMPLYIHCQSACHRPGWCGSFYDADWNLQDFTYGCPSDPVKAARPKNLDEMLRLSKILSQDFKHVRVDWYDLPDGRVLFGK